MSAGLERRSYRAETLEDALRLVSDELGPDALVVRQREGVIGGVGGFFGRRCVELEVELPAGPAGLPNERPAASPRPRRSRNPRAAQCSTARLRPDGPRGRLRPVRSRGPVAADGPSRSGSSRRLPPAPRSPNRLRLDRARAPPAAAPCGARRRPPRAAPEELLRPRARLSSREPARRPTRFPGERRRAGSPRRPAPSPPPRSSPSARRSPSAPVVTPLAAAPIASEESAVSRQCSLPPPGASPTSSQPHRRSTAIARSPRTRGSSCAR